jgi:hypothetical protein
MIGGIGFRHLMTTIEVAKKMGVSRGSVAHWCREGSIFPAFRVNGQWMIEPGFQILATKAKSRRGRPMGARNRKPYPLGVKRPRKQIAGDGV